jgi:hypothetical protein
VGARQQQQHHDLQDTKLKIMQQSSLPRDVKIMQQSSLPREVAGNHSINHMAPHQKQQVTAQHYKKPHLHDELQSCSLVSSVLSLGKLLMFYCLLHCMHDCAQGLLYMT